MESGGDTHNLFSGSAWFVVQARDVYGDIHVHLPPRPGTPLDAAANDLASEVLARSRDQAGLRDLANPSPLPVRWTTEHDEKADHQFNRGNATWAGDHDLTELTAAFRGLPQRRLVVLGAAGAGKTTLAMLLTQRLLTRGSPEDPVPVLFSLASWNPVRDHLRTWLVRQIEEQYPHLHALHGRDIVARLVRDRRVLPVLDGLDELPEQHRATAITMLNRSLADEDAVILTCRTAEYTAAVTTGDVLRSAAVIRAQPLTPDAAEEYLRRALPPARLPRWQPVFDRLHTDGELAGALSTPLMVWLARTVYAPADSAPSEIADIDRLASREAIENHLLDGLVPAVYRDEPGPADAPRRPQWTSEQAHRWLGFLADHLTRLGTGDLAWWHLYRSPLVRFVYWLLVGLGVALVPLGTALYAHWLADYDSGRMPATPEPVILLTVGFPLGFAIGALSEALAREFYGKRARTPGGPASRRVFGALQHAFEPKWVRWGAILSVCWLVSVQVFLRGLSKTGLPLLAAVVLIVAQGAFLARFEGVSSARPAESLRGDRTGVLLVLGIGGTAAGLLVTMPIAGTLLATPSTLWFLVLGVWLGVALPTLGLSAWGCWLLARVCLGASGRLPWRSMTFLRDAHRRDVLRQVGGVYQFRHRLLQERLAEVELPHASSVSTPVNPLEDTEEFVHVGRPNSPVKLSSAFLLPLLLIAVGLVFQILTHSFGIVGWVVIGSAAVDTPLTLVIYLVKRRAVTTVRITRDAIEMTMGRHHVRLSQSDVTEVTVRPIIVKRSLEMRLYGIHVRLHPHTALPSYLRRFMVHEGWVPLLAIGTTPTLSPELAAAIIRFAGPKWRPFSNEPS